MSGIYNIDISSMLRDYCYHSLRPVQKDEKQVRALRGRHGTLQELLTCRRWCVSV